jgi:hypothetical protein
VWRPDAWATRPVVGNVGYTWPLADTGRSPDVQKTLKRGGLEVSDIRRLSECILAGRKTVVCRWWYARRDNPNCDNVLTKISQSRKESGAAKFPGYMFAVVRRRYEINASVVLLLYPPRALSLLSVSKEEIRRLQFAPTYSSPAGAMP